MEPPQLAVLLRLKEPHSGPHLRSERGEGTGGRPSPGGLVRLSSLREGGTLLAALFAPSVI